MTPADLEALGVRVKPLEWHNFDAWTWWAECLQGTYHVEERNGGWRVDLRVGGLVHLLTETEDTLQTDFETAIAAANAHHVAQVAGMIERIE